MVAVDVIKNNLKRNPWRVLAIDKAEAGIYTGDHEVVSDNSDQNEDREIEPLLKEFQFH